MNENVSSKQDKVICAGDLAMQVQSLALSSIDTSSWPATGVCCGGAAERTMIGP